MHQRYINFTNILARGLFPIPARIHSRTDKFQSFPPKWKFTLLIYISALLVEIILWCTLQRFGLQQWHITTLQHTTDNPIDIRGRYALFLMFNVMAEIPIVSYLTLPFLTNRIFANWAFKKIDDQENNCLMKLVKGFNNFMYSGFNILEAFDSDALINRHTDIDPSEQMEINTSYTTVS